MANFKMIEMSKKLNKGRGAKYPKMIHAGMIDTDEMAQMVSEYTGSASSDVVGVLSALSSLMAKKMAEGFSVKLEGIGVFAPTLGLKKGTDVELSDSATKRNAQSVEVADIKYRADKALVRETSERAVLHRITLPHQPRPIATEEDRLRIAQKQIEGGAPLHIREYAALTGLDRINAGRELRSFAERGLLLRKGSHTHIYYTKP